MFLGSEVGMEILAIFCIKIANFTSVKPINVHFVIFKGGLISVSFSLWLNPPNNMPIYYPQL